jgi:mannose-6-phosphate isomerase-like protein (cupin superfamily)
MPDPRPDIQLHTIADLDACIIHTHQQQRIGPALAALLDPVDAATFHQYVLPATTPVELHYHDVDEYWWFTAGHPTVTLWSPTVGLREYHLEPGDLVACLRGIAHTLWADHTLVYHQFSSIPREGARGGHLVEGLPGFDRFRSG